jgi:homoserine O-succinyltransferase/O-acetyltransferase
VALALIAAGETDTDDEAARAARWTCAFVNNIPDGAFEATERQFLDLLDASSGAEVVAVRRYTMEGVARGERTRQRIDADYAPVSLVRRHPPDLLIVTGSEPVEAAVEDEPYWGELAGLLEWGSEHTASMLLSCLAAHAALAVFDGLARVTLPAKCTGVFEQRADAGHPLTAGLGRAVVLPHSRHNDVPVKAVCAAGYHVGLHSPEVGWSLVSKVVGRSQVLLVQGHPEYDPSSLLAEYRRDARRYVSHERDDLPRLPRHCAGPEDWGDLVRLQERLCGGERDPALVEGFDFETAGGRAPWPWRPVAEKLYANWLAGVDTRSD